MALWLTFAAFIYFLPWVIARGRKHHNSDAILVLNLFLGWTVLGWVIALVWACTWIRVADNDRGDPYDRNLQKALAGEREALRRAGIDPDA